MSETLTIQSHRGPYSVAFDDRGAEKLTSEAPPNAHFLIDANVARLYRRELGQVLDGPSVLTIEATEQNKSLEEFPNYVEHLVSHSARRTHALVAIGGGILQDITCFLAATLLRGMEWHFYPTTLLAQADSCIGSKSSINSGGVKNILGTFTPPSRVVISTRFLDTLDERDVRSGVGEMLKVHAIDGPNAFREIARDYEAMLADRAVMTRYIRRSLAIKKRIIEVDEFDRGLRNVMNYGHSFGHAIESATDFQVPHGIAVTIGMDLANHVAATLGSGSRTLFDEMHEPLRRNYAGFEHIPVPMAPFLTALTRDKKNVDSMLTLILPDRRGAIGKTTVPNDPRFRDVCEDYLTNLRGQ